MFDAKLAATVVVEIAPATSWGHGTWKPPLGPTDVAAHAGTSPLAGTALRGPPLVEKFVGIHTWALYLSGPTLGSIISGDPRMSRGDPQMVFHRMEVPRRVTCTQS